MSLLFSCQSVSKSFATRLLFEDLSLSVFSGDRIGLVGPNGSGKTTLMKIIAGHERADSGILSPKRGLKIGYLPQTCEFDDVPLEKVLMDAVVGEPEYEKERLAQMWLSKLGFSKDVRAASLLSGGWKKRLKLAVELINQPDLLLLDEPTNHLDLSGILWLEKFLMREAPTFLMVSHDRYFLQNVTSRVIEIDRAYPKGMFEVDADYQTFLERKATFLEGQLQQERSIASKARREAEWLQRGAKARTTKSQARIDDAEELFQEQREIRARNTKKKSQIDFAATERETRKLLTVRNLGKDLGGRALFRHLDFVLSPGARMGLMGPNGSGKTTLLKLIAGEIEPDQGTIKRADGLQAVYFDQHRAKLASHITLREALSPKGDYVLFRGQQVHVNGWCKRFLFSPDLLDMTIGNLSGGERARISIAHLMLQPADLLLLDEPTNDLDILTLETLEESLLEFPGAVVLITHDRCMLDRVCNSMLALGDPENPYIYPDYAQWEKAQNSSVPKEKEKKEEKKVVKGKLSYLEKKELEEMEGKIEALEKEVQLLNEELMKKEIAEDSTKLSQYCSMIALKETQIEQCYLRWEELEKKK